MQSVDKKTKLKYSWEQAIEILRDDPCHQELIFNSYLTRNLHDNCRRFGASEEFLAASELINQYAPGARRLLDMPGGNGIATHAFASAGFEVTCVEPNPSVSVGRGAIAQVLAASALDANIVDAWGENLHFDSNYFDVAYVRQGLHHAADLSKMLAELGRVLKPGGLLLACREHVVDNYNRSLQSFLATQVDHQLYGGEHAFTLPDYRAAIHASGLELKIELGPYESIINTFPNTPEVLRKKILASPAGRGLKKILPDDIVVSIGIWRLKRIKTPGRLYTFLAFKPLE